MYYYYLYAKQFLILCFILILISINKIFNGFFNITKLIHKMSISGGPLFIKFIQLLTQNTHVINDFFLNSIKDSIQTKCHPSNIKEITHILNKYNLNYKIDKFIGSGSIAQVFICIKDNKKYIVKHLHKDIKNTLIINFNLFKHVYNFIKLFVNIVHFNFEDVKNDNLKQCNLNNEKNNTENMKLLFKNNNEINIPKIYYSNEEIIIEEYIEGYHFTDFSKKFEKHSYNAKIKTLTFFLKMLLVHSMIHSDCHDGNIIYNLNEKNEIIVTFIDWGMIHFIDDTIKNKILKFLFHLGKRNIESMIIIIRELINYTTESYDDFEKSFEQITNKFDIHQNKIIFLKNLFDIIVEHRIKMPISFIYVLLNIIIISGNYKDLIDDAIIYAYNNVQFKDLKEKIIECDNEHYALQIIDEYKNINWNKDTDHDKTNEMILNNLIL